MTHVNKIDFVSKTNNVINSAVKNTSCNRGWLRLTVQCIFCSVIVASFCIIVYLSYRRSPETPRVDDPSRCLSSNCRVACTRAPSLGQYEDDIVHSVKEAGEECDGIYLTLNRPEFLNSTVPVHWLANFRGQVVELGIVGGNLRHIPAGAFMSTFFRKVETLVLEKVTITTWSSEMLLGLPKLKNLYIRDCKFEQIYKNALGPVDNTLRKLTIRSSGYFKPENITGSSNLLTLRDVNFSNNEFNCILNRNSFKELINCEVLSLASSRITAIQEGTFDALENIKIIYLNNNRLTTLPPGIFDRILEWGRWRLRIDLQDNLWECNCQIKQLIEMYNEGISIVDPVCVSPEELYEIPFSKIKTLCNESTEALAIKAKPKRKREKRRDTESIYITENCFTNTTTQENDRNPQRSISLYNCSFGRMRYIDTSTLQFITKNAKKFTTELQPLYYVEYENFSLVEISLASTLNYGLFWYKSSCPGKVYCVESLPSHMRLYNIGSINELYIICPMHYSGFIGEGSCISFNPSTDLGGLILMARRRIYFFALAIIGAGLTGALLIYGLIRKNPVLLKGSKRILIVKHKFAEALVLPPKIPPRFDTFKERPRDINNILAVPKALDGLTTPMLSRSSSIRSSKSSTPSYVSAIQPTDDQLMEWRLREHFHPSSLPSPVVNASNQISWIYDCDSLYYSVSSNSENTYENK